MEKQLFREKSIKSISSPEQLNDYVRVTTPGVWVILAAVIVLLVGACVWGVFGHLDTAVPACAVADGGSVICYIKESDIGKVQAGQSVTVDGAELRLSSVSAEPSEIGEGFDAYTLHVGGLEHGDWVYVAEAEGEVPDGVYTAEIVVDSVKPISFLMN